MDQAEVAEAIGETQSNFARWESGRVPRDTSTVKALAAYYKVNWLWLLHNEGPKMAEPTTAVEVVAGPAPPRSRGAASPTKQQKGAR